MLAGLKSVKSSEEIDLSTFASQIIENPEFSLITSVREFRCIDLGDIFCSNVKTSFISTQVWKDGFIA